MFYAVVLNILSIFMNRVHDDGNVARSIIVAALESLLFALWIWYVITYVQICETMLRKMGGVLIHKLTSCCKPKQK